MRRTIFAIAVALTFGGNSAFAVDCGEVPQTEPYVPNGETASAEEIRTARNNVVSYSDAIDRYLTCMDDRAGNIMPYLTKEQKERWNEDLAAVHEVRREIQNRMNMAIRTFRKSRG